MWNHPGVPPIAAATTLGPIRLTVADLPRARAFYESVLGLRVQADDGAALVLGAENGRPLVELVGRGDAAPRARGASGLFHLALLFPSRRALADALRRVATAGWRLEGASDHLVSEALYLSDPEGNGIELYCDRPRAQWTREETGELRMATLALDVDSLLAEASDELVAAVPADTALGHVHLQVAALEPAERFYADVLGFEVMTRSYPGALFVAAGGYHHHIGLNTWASRGGPRNLPGTCGLERFVVELPDAAERERIAARLAEAGVEARETDDGLLATDPFGNDVLLRVAGG
jgi:catechol 2,3-dioxygenase